MYDEQRVGIEFVKIRSWKICSSGFISWDCIDNIYNKKY